MASSKSPFNTFKKKQISKLFFPFHFTVKAWLSMACLTWNAMNNVGNCQKKHTVYSRFNGWLYIIPVTTLSCSPVIEINIEQKEKMLAIK